jgi:SAM-dependent methyltransferase
VISLDGLRALSPVADAAAEFCRLNSLSLVREPVRTCVVRIPVRSAAADLALNRRAAQDHAAPQVRRLSAATDIAPLLNDFFATGIHGSVGRPRCPFVIRVNRDFYRHLVTSLAPTGSLTLLAAYHEAAPTAFLLCLADGDALVWHASGVADAPDGQGELLLREALLIAREKGLAAVDVTRADGKIRNMGEKAFEDTVSLLIMSGRAGGEGATTAGGGGTLLHELAATVRTVINRKRIVEDHRRAVSDESTATQCYNAVASAWRRRVELQKAEERIFGEFRGRLGRMRMLDMGVGAGRTSLFFGRAAKSYVATDVAPVMLQACRETLGDYLDPSSFIECDARSMGIFADGSFDFILFSYNGIDCVNGDDRALVLSEVRRVGARGGWFCFSSHNIWSLTWRGARSPMEFLCRIRRYALLSAANPGLAAIARQPAASLCDAGLHYRFPLHYVSPPWQRRELEAMGFSEVRAFSPATGDELDPLDERRTCFESWVYYLCRM